MSDSRPVAVITGGHGDLAEAITAGLQTVGFEVHAPGRAELDVTSPDAVDRFFAPLGRIDLLVNNAGLANDGLFSRQAPDERDSVIDVNLKGAHLCSQAAAATMLRRRSGHILNIGSYSALHPPVGQTAYAAAKAGLVALTKSYAAELGKRNIRVNCVLPGFLETKMTAKLGEKVRNTALSRHILGRFTTLDEAADQIVFLAKCENISGQVFQLDSRI